MRILRLIRSVIVTSACLGMLVPVPCVSAAGADNDSLAAKPVVSGAIVADVALQDGGRLRGTIRDANGKLQHSDVLLIHGRTGHQYRTAADEQGRFSFNDVEAGTYRVVTADAALVCRCWSPGTAPPSAGQELLVVGDQRVLRGQRPLAEALFSRQTLLILMVAAAIAIPIAVHNSQDDAS